MSNSSYKSSSTTSIKASKQKYKIISDLENPVMRKSFAPGSKLSIIQTSLCTPKRMNEVSFGELQNISYEKSPEQIQMQLK